jgi:predicted acyltransferase
MNSTLEQPLRQTPQQSGQRLQSLDVLRGLTVAVMILVNNAGDGAASYAQLRHSVWNGCTVTDVVFPSFLFIVGVSIALALGARLDRGVSPQSNLPQIGKRSVLIFVIGLLLNALPFFHLAELRRPSFSCLAVCGQALRRAHAH